MKVKDILRETENKPLREATVGEILEKQKGFQYYLKKKGKKYYIYQLGKTKKVYQEGVEDLKELPTIVRPWLKATSLTFNKWSPKLQRELVKKYIRELKKTLEE